MAKSKALYKSYLLRLWRDEETGRVRIRLEEVNEEPQIYHFADIETFIGFLQPEPQAHEPYTGMNGPHQEEVIMTKGRSMHK